MTFPPATFAVSLVGAAGVLVWRIQETIRPVTKKSIIIPPLAMSTGNCMFFVPLFRVPWQWAVCSFLIGAVFLSFPLIKTSELSVRDDKVYLRRSKAFLWVLLVLVAIRLAARGWVERYVSLPQTAGLFFLLAFGMIVCWRVSMLREFLRLTRTD